MKFVKILALLFVGLINVAAGENNPPARLRPALLTIPYSERLRTEVSIEFDSVEVLRGIDDPYSYGHMSFQFEEKSDPRLPQQQGNEATGRWIRSWYSSACAEFAMANHMLKQGLKLDRVKFNFMNTTKHPETRTFYVNRARELTKENVKVETLILRGGAPARRGRPEIRFACYVGKPLSSHTKKDFYDNCLDYCGAAVAMPNFPFTRKREIPRGYAHELRGLPEKGRPFCAGGCPPMPVGAALDEGEELIREAN